MPSPIDVVAYEAVRDRIGARRNHVLLGNGFSVACDPIFSYASLYEAAVSAGLSQRAQAVFQELGTNNFEGVMHLLHRAHWVARLYGLIDRDDSPLLEDAAIVQRTLVDAVASSHLAHTGEVSDAKKTAALAFLHPFHNVFTTNYDLLTYWVVIAAPGGPRWGDGFREDKADPDAPYVVFSERLGGQPGLLYLHGALHLHVVRGELRKHCWSRTGTPLTELVREGLHRGEYPLFVAEGAPEQKLEQIQRVGYLWYAMDKLARIKGPLVVFGHSLGPSDQHITDTLAMNLDLPLIAISLYGDPDSESNKAIVRSVEALRRRRVAIVERQGRGAALDVLFFDSETADVWGSS